MKIKIDEHLPNELLVEFRNAGHEADSVFDEGLAGSPDDTLLDCASTAQRVLITLDKGIADIRSYPPGRYQGIVLLRPKFAGRQSIVAFVQRHVIGLLSRDLTGELLVVTESGVRTRQS